LRTRIKICGITRREDAELAVELGASAVGFNFYPRSPRYVTPASAAEMVAMLPPTVIAVGVFADETNAARVVSVAGEARVGALQLHGPRFPESAARFTYPVIRAVAVDAGFEPEALRRLEAAAFLLDAFDPVAIGGTGRTIDWTKAREATRYGQVILAGGLTPENVDEAIRQVRPLAVDVASGVEASPGVKDPEKLRAFFAAVEEADRT
jgi:phosphoribosylanthranilate isomerase